MRICERKSNKFHSLAQSKKIFVTIEPNNSNNIEGVFGLEVYDFYQKLPACYVLLLL
jgi:hypothetical protein